MEISDYDPAWPARFEHYSRLLKQALGDVAQRIEHVGSTAVPGLAAKPIIDLQLSVTDVASEAAYRPQIEALGMQLTWIEPHHRYFRPPPDVPRLWQVHVCSVGSEWERVHLLFRDYLRAHPDTAAEYAALKRGLAGEYRNDRLGYVEAKTPFITGVLASAEEWARATGWEQ